MSARLKNGQRVLVSWCGEFDVRRLMPPAAGTVVRVRRGDDGAWVALDVRREEAMHPFPADDERGSHVLVYPEGCKPIKREASAR
jgi:hypothetical protein